jgi:5'(3')-deoxyribonucleotidase
MNKAIFFDMDGTIADLYGVSGWLDDLRAERVRPYAEARPLVNLSALARRLNRLTAEGYTVNIISWTSRGGSAEYNKAVAEVKREWLAKHLPSVSFTAIHIIPYGTPKSTCGRGILFDDEQRNLDEWGEGAHAASEIFEILRGL